MVEFNYQTARLGLSVYLQFAWRNLVRHPQRTLLSVFSILLATAFVAYLGAINDGWMRQMQKNFILTFTGHMQIHHPEHWVSAKLSDYIKEPSSATNILQTYGDQIRWSPRVETAGLASVASNNAGVTIVAVDPERERQVSRLYEMLDDDVCPPNGNWIMLGQDVAATLNVTKGNTLVLTSEGVLGRFYSDLFTVCGVLRSGAPQIDRQFAVISLEVAQRWLGLGGGITHLAVRIKDPSLESGLVEALNQRLDNNQLLAVAWQDIDPMVAQWLGFSDAYSVLILMIVVALAVIQVGNTMMMSTYDRKRELGLMLALGANRRQLFLLILIEAAILVLLGGLLGYALALFVAWLGSAGIDFSLWSDAFEFFYMDPVIKPVLTAAMGAKIVAALAIAIALGGFYPAWNVSRQDPVEAMR